MSITMCVAIFEKLESMKRKLTVLVEQYGFNHPEVIKCSQELDELIYNIQKKSV